MNEMIQQVFQKIKRNVQTQPTVSTFSRPLLTIYFSIFSYRKCEKFPLQLYLKTFYLPGIRNKRFHSAIDLAILTNIIVVVM